MDENHLYQVAEDCRHYIVRHSAGFGILGGDLSSRVKSYAPLNNREKFRVQIMLCKMPCLSVVAITTRVQAFRFYPAHDAPPGAFNIGDADKARAEADIMARALAVTA